MQRTGPTQPPPQSMSQASVRANIIAQYLLGSTSLLSQGAFALLVWFFLGSEAYGRIAPLMALCALFTVLCDFGAQITGPVLLGAVSRPVTALRRAHALIAFRLLLACTVFVPAGLLTAMVFFPETNRWLLAALVAIAAATGAVSPMFYFLARGRMDTYAVVATVLRTGALVLLAGMGWAHSNLYGMLLVYVMTSLLLALFTVRQLPQDRRRPRRFWRLTLGVGQRARLLGASMLIGNVGLSLPFIVAAPWIPEREMAWLHLGASVSQASASLTEPIGMTWYARTMAGTQEKDLRLLWRLQIAVGAGVSLLGWLGIAAAWYFVPGLAGAWHVVQPLALRPMIIASAHLAAVAVLRQGLRRRHFAVYVIGTFLAGALSALGAWLTGHAVAVAWVIVATEASILLMFIAAATIGQPAAARPPRTAN